MKASATRFSFILISMLLLGLVSASAQNINTDSAAKTDPDSSSLFKDKRFSAELFLNYPYYFLSSPSWLLSKSIKYNNCFNYGGGIFISKYFGRIKLKTGFYISSCNYYHKLSIIPTTIIDKIRYWNIPIIVSVKLWKFRPFIGVIITKPFYYNNHNNKNLLDEINKINYHTSPGGASSPIYTSLNYHFMCVGVILAGLEYNQKLNRSLYLNLSVSYARKPHADVYVYAGISEPEDAFLNKGPNSIYFNLGLEYIFKNKK